ncbi:hypothetical protein [Amycolatopsis taiwanensis]|uniref:hypothetical protein n=1 Tax=Amycolatopsis taiwanensis TaxID=342230 RepID=UPI0004881FB3|nr:hypothetical protein [Amycolatopsis taiwanensis]
MASTKPNIRSVKIDSLNLWADDAGTIHMTTDDRDVKDGFHTYISNNPKSKRYHPSAYAQLARILRSFGKDVPGWEDGPAAS